MVVLSHINRSCDTWIAHWGSLVSRFLVLIENGFWSIHAKRNIRLFQRIHIWMVRSVWTWVLIADSLLPNIFLSKLSNILSNSEVLSFCFVFYAISLFKKVNLCLRNVLLLIYWCWMLLYYIQTSINIVS